MRVLLATSLGGAGHLTPVLSVARACRQLGHEVRVLVPPALAPDAERTGLPVTVGGQPPQSEVDEMWRRLRAGPPEAVVGLMDRELFADRCTRHMLAPARAARDAMRPHLVVHEPCEYAAAIAAHEGGIAQAQVAISLAALERGVLDRVSPIVDRHGPGVAAAIAAAPYLTPFPASLDPSPWPVTRRFRTEESPPGVLPDWWPGDDRPLAYVSFGSVTGHLAEAAEVYRSALDAVGDLPARVLLTVGRAVDVAALGAFPANVHVEQWVPQAQVLAQAAVVVCHGGSGTTFGALAAGVPLVICPLFADQPRNGALVEAAGAGVMVTVRDSGRGGLRSLGSADVAALRAAVDQVLFEPSYRRGAEKIGHEMAATSSLAEVLGDLLGEGTEPDPGRTPSGQT